MREGEIVRVADRIAYVNHDVDDALRAGVISWSDLPKGPLKVLGDRMSVRIDVMVRDMILTSRERGEISLSKEVYAALMELRTWLFKNVYHNPRSRNQKAGNVVAALFEHYLHRPEADKERPRSRHRDRRLRRRHDRPLRARDLQTHLPAPERHYLRVVTRCSVSPLEMPAIVRSRDGQSPPARARLQEERKRRRGSPVCRRVGPRRDS